MTSVNSLNHKHIFKKGKNMKNISMFKTLSLVVTIAFVSTSICASAATKTTPAPTTKSTRDQSAQNLNPLNKFIRSLEDLGTKTGTSQVAKISALLAIMYLYYDKIAPLLEGKDANGNALSHLATAKKTAETVLGVLAVDRIKSIAQQMDSKFFESLYTLLRGADQTETAAA